MNKITTTVLGLAVTALLVQPASAQFAERVTLRGFGEFHYGKTDENPYLGGNEDGSYGNILFHLDMSASLSDRVSVKALAFWGEETKGDEEDAEVEIDIAWAQYRISDAVSFRAGRSRVPYGSYGEILEVGTLRPFFTLPRGIYGASGIVAENYQGFGLGGTRFGQSGWGVQWDIFGGHMAVASEHAPAESLEEDPLAPPEEEEHEEEGPEEVNNMIGGHVTFFVPLEGLSFGFGGFTGDVTEEGKRHSSLIGSAAYEAGELFLRGEAGYHRESSEKEVLAWYLEAAYKTPAGVQLGLRYDALDYDFLEAVDVRPGAEGAQEHKDLTFLLGYWFSPAFALKAELHLVDGNFFAHDEGFGERLEAGGLLDKNTTAFIIGSQFSF